MEINTAYTIHGTQGISAPHKTENYARNTDVELTGNAAVKDEVEISSQAQQMSETLDASRTLETGDIRLDLVNEARAKIASGYYDAPEFLEMALERMLERNFG